MRDEYVHDIAAALREHWSQDPQLVADVPWRRMASEAAEIAYAVMMYRETGVWPK